MHNEVLGPLLFFIARYRLVYSALIGVSVFAAVCEALMLASLYPLVAVVMGSDAGGVGPLLGLVGSITAGTPEDGRIGLALALFIVVALVTLIAKILREWLTAFSSTRIAYDVKQRMFGRLLEAPYLYVIGLPPGHVVYRLTVAPRFLSNTLLMAGAAAGLVFSVTATSALLISIDVGATLGFVVLAGVLVAANRYAMVGYLVRAGRHRFNATTAETGIATEFGQGFREIVLARAGQGWAERFAAQGDIVRRRLIQDIVYSAAPGLALELAVVLLIALGGAFLYLVAPSTLRSIPALAVYALGVRQLLSQLTQLNRTWLVLAGIAPDLGLIQNALTESFPTVRSGGQAMPARWSRLRLRDVSVVYPGRSELALDSLSLDLRRGEMLAIVGPSGSGKSTILHLIARLIDPTHGRVELDGMDAAEIDRGNWLDRIGYVGQEGLIFDASVRDNIAFGRRSSDAEIEAAAGAAHATEFISRLPDGYATRLGERGTSLSAGQRQRLLIARALLRDAEILLLDEATSALDPESERLVHDALRAIRRHCTIVLVAHGPRLIRSADRILVVEAGRLVEEGDHAELVRQAGSYARLASGSHGLDPV